MTRFEQRIEEPITNLTPSECTTVAGLNNLQSTEDRQSSYYYLISLFGYMAFLPLAKTHPLCF